jgi:VWFA-related protein
MHTFHYRARLLCLTAALLFPALALRAQDRTPTPKPANDDDVIRVSTTLVQTDVTVFDKQGKFVAGLKPEEFAVRINGSPVEISSVELLTTGSAQEKAQIAAARGGRPATVTGATAPSPLTLVEGRSLFLFVDDIHLTGESLIRVRQMLANTIDAMTPNDRAVVVTASGQLGIQNLSSDKEAIKATIARIAQRPGIRQSLESPPMSEGAAIAINRGDTAVIDYYVRRLRDPVASREMAIEHIKGRANDIIEQSAPFASNTLAALEGFVHELANVPGRKLLFFVSDGFMIENERSMSYARLSGATQEAARGGVVIYSLNARGLVTGSSDASDGAGFDPALSRVVHAAESAGQDVLYSLADDTGGRALINNNDINLGIQRALEETSRYYLLAWKPPQDVAERGKVKRVEVTIIGHPELKVRTRRGVTEAVATALTASNLTGTPAPGSVAGAELLAALNSDVPPRAIPASLVVAYRSVNRGSSALTASLQWPSSTITFADVNGKRAAALEVGGVVLDQAGKQVTSFAKRIVVGPDSNAVDPVGKLVYYNYEVNLAPGRYLVKLAVRDTASGRLGSTQQAIEIPELANGLLALSSLMLNERTAAVDDEEASELVGAKRGVARIFGRESRLRFLTYVYNAKPVAADDNEPDLNVEVKILRGSQAVLSPALREITIERGSDAGSFPYVAEIPLSGLQPGEYTLQVTVTDLTTKASATQQIAFAVE